MEAEKPYGSQYWLRKLILQGALNDELKEQLRLETIKGPCVPSADNFSEQSVETYLVACGMIDKGHDFNNWWVGSRGKKATWDYICQAEINGKNGLILLEAKAHKSETSKQWKAPPDRSKVKNYGQAQANHDKIERNIDIEFEQLSLPKGTKIREYYQIANRIAYANKVCHVLGMPVLLVFLGFINDPHFKRDCWKSADEWQHNMQGYLKTLGMDHLLNAAYPKSAEIPGIRILSKHCKDIQ